MRPTDMTWQPPVFERIELAEKSTRHCIVVTAWNEGDRLRDQLARMQSYTHLADVVIADWRSNDGSTEPEFLRERGVRTLLETDEGGLGTAIRMGLAYAIEEGYDGVVTVDGNGKDGVDAIPELLRRLDQGWDFVQGSRFLPSGEHANTPADRYLGIRCFVAPLLSIAGGRWITDPTNGFRAMSRAFLVDPRVQPVRRVFVRFNLQLYLVFRAASLGFRFIEIPVVRKYPSSGSIPTKINHLRTKLLFVAQLLWTVAGGYNPARRDRRGKR
jgi:hypothetical protein